MKVKVLGTVVGFGAVGESLDTIGGVPPTGRVPKAAGIAPGSEEWQ